MKRRPTVLMRRLPVSSLRYSFKVLALCLPLQSPLLASDAVECVALKRVDIETSEVLPAGDQRQLIEPFLSRCIDADLIREMLADISGFLIERGYVTTRPYLLEQDISDGQLDIRVLIGTIEAIVDAQTGNANGKIASAFAAVGPVLNLRELETSLEAIERPASVTASFEIRPGTRQGSSVVAVKTETSNRFRTELGINAQTDLDSQLSFGATLDNLFNINDVVRIRYNSGEAFRAYQSNRSRELNYSFPLGSYLLAWNHSDITFDQRVQGLNGSFLSEGDTVSDEVQISKILTRNQTDRFSLALALELKDSRSYLDQQLIDVSSYKTSQLRLLLHHDWYQPWGQLNTRFSYHRGLDSFGARDDDYFTLDDGSDSEAKLQFEKFNINSQLYYNLPHPAWYANVNMFLQHSDDILFDNDKLYLGSPYTVRGYSSDLSGSNGWYLHADLVHRLRSVPHSPNGKPQAKSILLSLGIDYGDIKCEVDNPDVCGEIYGVGLGIEIADTNFLARLSWGHPLKQIGDEIGDKDRFSLDLRWSL